MPDLKCDNSPITLVTRLSEAEEMAWCERLRTVLPGETVMRLCDLSPEARARAEIAIVANPDPADLAALPQLRWVHSLWAGVERLVAELPDGFRPPLVRLVDPELARTMAEAVLAWTYYLFRDMPAYARQQRAHDWHQHVYRRPETVTVGILGLGALGAAAAGRLLGAGFRVAGWSRSPKALPGVACLSGDSGLRDLLAQSDILVCLLPLTAETRGLLNAERLALLPRGAQLINFGRGPIVDTGALLGALGSGALGHAVLDVFEREPLDQASPLWDHPGVTVLPHVSAPTDPESAALIVAGNIRRWRETGTLPATVDFVRGY